MMLQLKDAYPNFQIKLPGKRWFKDNFDAGITIENIINNNSFSKRKFYPFYTTSVILALSP